MQRTGPALHRGRSTAGRAQKTQQQQHVPADYPRATARAHATQPSHRAAYPGLVAGTTGWVGQREPAGRRQARLTTPRLRERECGLDRLARTPADLGELAGRVVVIRSAAAIFAALVGSIYKRLAPSGPVHGSANPDR